MWAYDFFQAEPSVKTLKTHLKANNVFLRWYTQEYYLPEDARLSAGGRTCRLLNTLLVYTAVVLFLVARKDTEYALECSYRRTCKLGCILDNFPDLKCSAAPNLSVEHGGQLFEQLYKYEYIDPKDSGSGDAFAVCASKVPRFSQNSVEAQEKLLHDNRLPRTQVCFPLCVDRITDVDALDSSNQEVEDDSSGRWTDLYNAELDIRPPCTTSDPLSEERRALLCVDSSETCEVTRFKDEMCLPTTDACFKVEVVLVACIWCIPFHFFFDMVIIYTVSVRVESVQDCAKGSTKCGMHWLLTALFFTIALVVSSTIVKSTGRPGMIWFTWLMVILVDQVRNIVSMVFVWFVVLRRCGQVPLLDEAVAYKADEDEEVQQSPVDIFRRIVALCVESRPFELGVYVLVGFYAFFILVQMGIEPYIDPAGTVADVMFWLDAIFLAVFVVEILARTIAHGLWYLKDIWNAFDAAVVFTSVVFKFLGDTSRQVSLLRLLRLLRLVLVMRKAGEKKRPPLQSGGLTFSSPVERVLDIMKEIRETKGISSSVREQIDWASDIIASNKLYSISVDADKSKTGEGFLEQEVQDWVRIGSDASGESTWRDNELEKFLVGGNKKRLRDELAEQAGILLQKDIEDVVVRRREVEAEKQAKLEEEAANQGGEEAAGLKPTQATRGTIFRTRSQATGTSAKQTTFGITSSIAPAESAGHPLLQVGPPSEAIEAEVDRVLQYMQEKTATWDFDIFQLEKLAKERTLQMVVMQAFMHQELFAVLEIQPQVVLDYLVVIEQGYIKRNPFHNSVHAADVAQAFHVFMLWLNEKYPNPVITGQDAVAGLIASAVHDYEHPGFNNPYLVRTRHATALRYNDSSVLEHHHISAAFRVMLDMPTDPLSNLSESQYSQVRRMMVSMVLATDIGTHFSELSLFKTKLSSKDFPGSAKGEDKMVLMNILLHAADLSNPARPFELYAQGWVPRVMEEFFRQGDIEKEKNMPVSMFFDRDNTNVAKCQMGFMDVLVLPLYSVLATVVSPSMNEHLMPKLSQNRAAFGAQLALDGGDDHNLQQMRKSRTRGVSNRGGCPSWVTGLLRKLRRGHGGNSGAAPIAPVPSSTMGVVPGSPTPEGSMEAGFESGVTKKDAKKMRQDPGG